MRKCMLVLPPTGRSSTLVPVAHSRRENDAVDPSESYSVAVWPSVWQLIHTAVPDVRRLDVRL